MKLMTWNIRLGIQRGLGPVAQTLNEHSPDVVALQEVGRYWIMGPGGDTTAELARAAGFEFQQFVPCIRTSGGAEYGHAVLSRYPLERRRVISLPQAMDEPRCLFEATVVSPSGPFVLLTTHLSHVDDRPAQASKLQDAMNVTGPKILMGDLNEDDAVWLDDLRKTLVDPGSEQNLTFPSSAPSRRIDYIMGQGFEFGPLQVLQTGDASDHLPVVVSVTSSSPS